MSKSTATMFNKMENVIDIIICFAVNRKMQMFFQTNVKQRATNEGKNS